MARVDDPVRLVLRLEFTAVAEPVTGAVFAEGRQAQPFSGWSELFAALMAITAERAEQPDATP
jgi:hypothetical protein